MRLDFYHNKIVGETITAEFEDCFERELVPYLRAKHGDIDCIQMYEDYIADKFLLDGYWYYPLTVVLGDDIKTEWIRWPLTKNDFDDGLPYAFSGSRRVGFEICDAPAEFEAKLVGRARYAAEGSIKVRVEIVDGDVTRLCGRYSQTFIDEMARQLTAEIENATGVEDIAKSSFELVMMFASGTYMEHISDNVTYRRLMILDRVSAPRDFWIKWTRLDGAVAHPVSANVSESNILFELGEDVEQKVREKEYRYLLATGKDKYHNSMGRKKVTEWREVIKRAARRGELTKVESDFELAPETLELEERIADLLGRRIEARNNLPKEEVPYITPGDDEFARAMEKMRMVVESAETEAEPEAEEIVLTAEQTDEAAELIEPVAEEAEEAPEIPKLSDEAEETEETADEVELEIADESDADTDEEIELELIDEPDETIEEIGETLSDESAAEEEELDIFADEEETPDEEDELEFDLLDAEPVAEEIELPEEEPVAEELAEEPALTEEIIEETVDETVEELSEEPAEESDTVDSEALAIADIIDVIIAEEPVAEEISDIEEPVLPDIVTVPVTEEIELPAEEEPVAEEPADETEISLPEEFIIEEPVAQTTAPKEAYIPQPTIAERVADIRAELETKIRLEYESRARIKAEQEIVELRREQQRLLKENEAMLAEARAEQERLRLEYEHLLEMTERAAAMREAEEKRRREEEAQLRAEIEAQLRAEASERERLAEAARMAIEEQHRLEAENARIARQREEEERLEAEKARRLEEEKALEEARRAETERIRRENEEAKARAKNAMPTVGDGRYTHTSKSVKLVFRRSVDPNITTRIYEIIKATVDYYGKDNVSLKIRATVPDSQTVILDFTNIPIEEMELLGNIIKILGNSGLGIAKAIVN